MKIAIKKKDMLDWVLGGAAALLGLFVIIKSAEGSDGEEPPGGPVLDFPSISIRGINGVPFASTGIDPDGVPFASLGANGVNIGTLRGLSVQWKNKNLNFGAGQQGYSGMDIYDAGFMVSFLLGSSNQVDPVAPVFVGFSQISGNPAKPFDASATLNTIFGSGSWLPGYYDALFEFAVLFDSQDPSSFWTVPEICSFRLKLSLYVNAGGSV